MSNRNTYVDLCLRILFALDDAGGRYPYIELRAFIELTLKELCGFARNDRVRIDRLVQDARIPDEVRESVRFLYPQLSLLCHVGPSPQRSGVGSLTEHARRYIRWHLSRNPKGPKLRADEVEHGCRAVIRLPPDSPSPPLYAISVPCSIGNRGPGPAPSA